MSLRMFRSGCWRQALYNSCKWRQTQWSPWGLVAGYSSWNIINETSSFLNIILISPWMRGTHPGRSWYHPRAPSGPSSAKFPPGCGCWQPTRRGRTRAQGQSHYRHGRLDQDVKTLTTMLILSCSIILAPGPLSDSDSFCQNSRDSATELKNKSSLDLKLTLLCMVTTNCNFLLNIHPEIYWVKSFPLFCIFSESESDL